MEPVLLSVSEFIATTNQTLEYAYPSVAIEGEVAGFKVNQGKYVFFDLKDSEGSVNCFMMVFSLRVPIEDGMRVIVTGVPKLTPWGKFSVTVRAVKPSGQGSLKKSFELLREKLQKEGLFAPERKRVLPRVPKRVAVVSSTQAAGYADFIKIVSDRWGGLEIDVAQVQVQGEAAPDQMIRAIRYFNERTALADVLVIIRGGGSADDLAAFNDERLVREIAGSRIPTLVGVGHETDETLADLAADVRAATPSNAAQLLVPDKKDTLRHVQQSLWRIMSMTEQGVMATRREVQLMRDQMIEQIDLKQQEYTRQLAQQRTILEAYNPLRALERGYAIMRGSPQVGEVIEVETNKKVVHAEVQNVREK